MAELKHYNYDDQLSFINSFISSATSIFNKLEESNEKPKVNIDNFLLSQMLEK